MIAFRNHERLSVSLLAFLVTFVFVAFFREVLGDPDAWWHLAAGRWIAEHGRVPHGDPFSHSMAGAPWHVQEWLSELVMWFAFKAGGWGAVIALVAFAAGLAAAILWYFSQRYLPPAIAILLGVPALLCLIPSAWVRPHMLVLPIMVAWLIGLATAREKDRAPPLSMALVILLWANMHASFLLGLIMIVPFAAEAVIEPGDRKKALIDWSLVGAAAALAGHDTPFGVEGVL